MPIENIAGSIQPFSRESVPSSIIRMITDLLISKEIKPGDQLPTETELARHLGVGRNSVREAVKMLSYLGVVEIRRGVGTFVPETMPSSVFNPLILSLVLEQKTSREIIELRLLIETAVAEVVMQKAGLSDLKKLAEANEQLRIAAAKQDCSSAQLRDLDIHFHDTLLQLTDNKPLHKIGRAIYALFRASIEQTVTEDPQRAVRNHQLVIDAIRKKDMGLLRRHMRESLSFWMQSIQP